MRRCYEKWHIVDTSGIYNGKCKKVVKLYNHCVSVSPIMHGIFMNGKKEKKKGTYSKNKFRLGFKRFEILST